MRLVIFLLLLIISLNSKCQTCILFVSLNDSVVIGADSKAGIIINPIFKRPNQDSAMFREDCKIQHEKNVFYIASGKSSQTLLKYGKKSISNQKIFTDSIEYLQSEAIEELEKKMEITRLTDQKNYLKLYGGKSFGHMGFVWFNGKSPKACGLEFRRVSELQEKVKIEIEYFHFEFPKDNRLHIQPFGTYASISKFFPDVSFWSGKSIEKSVEKLLTIQSKATPNVVGAPYSIVRISKNYIRWYKKGKCE